MHVHVCYYVVAMTLFTGWKRVWQAQQGHVWALREGVSEACVCVVQGSGVCKVCGVVRRR